MSELLNEVFFTFDASMFNILNNLAKTCGGFFTPVFKVISLIGEKGLIFFLSSLILMLFSKTRKFGICMFGAVACGALITNVILKDLIARPRPFEVSAEYFDFYKFIGAPEEDGFSFPSGHMTATMSAMTVVFIFCNKKWSWVSFIFAILMGVSRVYLISHYATDVLAGIIVGALSGIVALLITNLIFKILYKYEKNKLSKFILNFDIVKLFKSKNKGDNA